MFLSRYLIAKSAFWKNFFLSEPVNNSVLSSLRKYYGVTKNSQYCCTCMQRDTAKSSYWSRINKISYSRISSKDGVTMELQKKEQELENISKLFPHPKQTLNEVASKMPQKIFDVYHKELKVPPKGNRKRIPNGEWMVTYAFTWPTKIKFESTSISKRIASNNAATQALHWLYVNKHIDSIGNPIYKEDVLKKIRSTLNEPIKASISEKSMNVIDKIWNEYESDIKPIYDAIFEEAANKEITGSPPFKDSTVDDEDEFSEIEADLEDSVDSSEALSRVHPVYGRNIKEPSVSTLQRRNRILEKKFEKYYEELTPLPIDDYTKQITSALETSRVLIIVGEAGCGKSTRVPAAILKNVGAGTAAVVSEPRRVAAIGLARRVASELGEEVGESIGYQVRLQSRHPKPPCGSVLYCTSGILLRRFRTNPGLEGCSHVIIDEAHERDINTDIMLLLLKRALDINANLKVVIMSATLNIDVLMRYFESCPVLEVPGRTFPVDVSYLEDIQKKYSLQLSSSIENCQNNVRPGVNCRELVDVIKAVDAKECEGAILVFLPGWAEIKLTKQLLDENYGESTNHMILPVHSRLSTQDQAKMFATPPPGIRKIVLATTIAETSITIPDVVHVIDSGIYKEHRTREGTGTTSLEKAWVSLASAKQRAGRAGRVQPGHCYRLYTKERESELIPHNTAEILRVPLEETVLDCKTYAPEDRVESFLSQLPEPPSRTAIEYAVNDLIDLGALTPSEKLTRLGSLLSGFSLRPRLAYSLLISAAIGNVLSVANFIAYCANDLQVSNDIANASEFRELKRKYSASCDYAALYWLQTEFERIDHNGREGAEWCDKYNLRKDRLRFVKSLSSLHLEQLLKSGVVEPNPDPEELTRFSGIDELTSAVLLAGSNSLLTTRQRVKTKGKLSTVTEVFTSTSDRAHIGSESVNYDICKRSSTMQLLSYHSGRHSNDRRALVVYNTSIVSPHTVLLFSKGDIREDVLEEDNNTVVISLPRHNLSVYVPKCQSAHILRARTMLWDTFQYYIDRNLTTMDYSSYSNVSKFKTRLVKAVGRMLVEGQKKNQRLDDESDHE